MHRKQQQNPPPPPRGGEGRGKRQHHERWQAPNSLQMQRAATVPTPTPPPRGWENDCIMNTDKHQTHHTEQQQTPHSHPWKWGNDSTMNTDKHQTHHRCTESSNRATPRGRGARTNSEDKVFDIHGCQWSLMLRLDHVPVNSKAQ